MKTEWKQNKKKKNEIKSNIYNSNTSQELLSSSSPLNYHCYPNS